MRIFSSNDNNAFASLLHTLASSSRWKIAFVIDFLWKYCNYLLDTKFHIKRCWKIGLILIRYRNYSLNLRFAQEYFEENVGIYELQNCVEKMDFSYLILFAALFLIPFSFSNETKMNKLTFGCMMFTTCWMVLFVRIVIFSIDKNLV